MQTLKSMKEKKYLHKRYILLLKTESVRFSYSFLKVQQKTSYYSYLPKEKQELNIQNRWQQLNNYAQLFTEGHGIKAFITTPTCQRNSRSHLEYRGKIVSQLVLLSPVKTSLLYNNIQMTPTLAPLNYWLLH